MVKAGAVVQRAVKSPSDASILYWGTSSSPSHYASHPAPRQWAWECSKGCPKLGLGHSGGKPGRDSWILALALAVVATWKVNWRISVSPLLLCLSHK